MKQDNWEDIIHKIIFHTLDFDKRFKIDTDPEDLELRLVSNVKAVLHKAIEEAYRTGYNNGQVAEVSPMTKGLYEADLSNLLKQYNCEEETK